MTERDEFEKWCDLTERDLTDLDLFAAWQASRLAALQEAIRATVQAKTTSHACDAIRALSQKDPQ